MVNITDFQDMAQPASLSGASKPPPGGEDHTQLFAQMVARTAKDIEVKSYIDICIKLQLDGRFWWILYQVRRVLRSCR